MPTQNSPLSQILLHEPRVKQSHVEAIEPGSLGISELQPDDRRRQVEKVTNKGVQLGAELNGMWILWKGGGWHSLPCSGDCHFQSKEAGHICTNTKFLLLNPEHIMPGNKVQPSGSMDTRGAAGE